MKADIHPVFYTDTKVVCACGNTWTTASTKKVIHTDVCSKCHPFYTGEQRIVDTEGQVDRFYKKLQARQQYLTEIETREAARVSRRPAPSPSSSWAPAPPTLWSKPASPMPVRSSTSSPRAITPCWRWKASVANPSPISRSACASSAIPCPRSVRKSPFKSLDHDPKIKTCVRRQPAHVFFWIIGCKAVPLPARPPARRRAPPGCAPAG